MGRAHGLGPWAGPWAGAGPMDPAHGPGPLAGPMGRGHGQGPCVGLTGRAHGQGPWAGPIGGPSHGGPRRGPGPGARAARPNTRGETVFQKMHFSKVPVENKYFPNDFNVTRYFFPNLKLSNYACYRLPKRSNIFFSKSVQTIL